ncbi:MAG: hypothetical protein AAGD05_12900, partial [Bacteroidota bacterium]
EYQPGFAFNSPDDPKPFHRNRFQVATIEIPFDIGYIIRSKSDHVNFPIGIGGAISFNLDTEMDAQLISPRVENGALPLPGIENEFDFSFYSIVFFAGVEFKLNDQLIVGIEPNFKLAPNQFMFELTDSIARTQYETGLNLRIRLR